MGGDPIKPFGRSKGLYSLLFLGVVLILITQAWTNTFAMYEGRRPVFDTYVSRGKSKATNVEIPNLNRIGKSL